MLRNHRGKFYEGSGQTHKSNGVLRVALPRAVLRCLLTWFRVEVTWAPLPNLERANER